MCRSGWSEAKSGMVMAMTIWTTPISASAQTDPDCAEPVIGRRFAPTRWLHPGYGSRRSSGSAEQRIEQQFHVQNDDDAGHDPRRGGDGAGDGKIAHLPPIGHEPHQRNDGERKLHRQHDLTEDQKLSGAALTIKRGDDDDRHNGDAAGEKPPRPAWETQMKEAFHHDLAGKRRRHG